MNRMLFLVGRLILWRAPDVEARTAPCRGPQWLTLPERSDRSRMGDRGAYDPACPPPWWAQTIGQRARGAERDFLHPMDRVSVEGGLQDRIVSFGGIGMISGDKCQGNPASCRRNYVREEAL